MEGIWQSGQGIMAAAGIIGVALFLGLVAHYLIFKVMQNLAKRTQVVLANSIGHCLYSKSCCYSIQLPLIAFSASSPPCRAFSAWHPLPESSETQNPKPLYLK